MKKCFITAMSICMMAMLFTVPVVAAEVSIAEPVYQEIAPRNEPTRLYFRTYHGQLQMRVWGMSSMRWLTGWVNVV